MKVLFINSVCGIGSTGRICVDLAQNLEKEGHEVKIAYGRTSTVPYECQKYAIRIGSNLDLLTHGFISRLFDNHGLGSRRATKTFLRWAEDYHPDLLWIHNLHGYYINYELLFEWIKSHPEMEVKWTLHDCWAFTGHCAHFSFVNCAQWEKGCEHCSQINQYPKSILLDRSRINYIRKRNAFTNVGKMSIITPSQWMKNKIERSFLGEYKVDVVNNSVDADVFSPTPSSFRSDYGLIGKKIVLGVSSIWNERKGLDIFIELSHRLDESFKIVLVGVNRKLSKKLPPSILSIEHVDSKKELAAIYSAADIFLNPSREESFGLTTLEAKLCGTRVIALKDTPAEEIVDAISGELVDNNIENILSAIYKEIKNKEDHD